MTARRIIVISAGPSQFIVYVHLYFLELRKKLKKSAQIFSSDLRSSFHAKLYIPTTCAAKTFKRLDFFFLDLRDSVVNLL